MKTISILTPILTLIASCSTIPKEPRYLSQQQIENKYSTGNKVVMITHPHCGFSRRAFQDFDQSTKDYLTNNGVLIAPVLKKHEDEELSGVIAWNKDHPDSQHIPVDSENKLKDLSLNSTPQFYFFRDGNLIGKVTGWPKGKANASKVQNYISQLKKKNVTQ